MIDRARAALALEKLLTDRPGYVLDVVMASDFDGWLVRAQRLRGAWSRRAVGSAPLPYAEMAAMSKQQLISALSNLADLAVWMAGPR